jgi:hypothetical protein
MDLTYYAPKAADAIRPWYGLGPVRRTRRGVRLECDGITLTSSHDSQPQTVVARLMSIPMSLLFKGVAKKAILQDLNEIKSVVKQESSIAD